MNDNLDFDEVPKVFQRYSPEIFNDEKIDENLRKITLTFSAFLQDFLFYQWSMNTLLELEEKNHKPGELISPAVAKMAGFKNTANRRTFAMYYAFWELLKKK